MQLRSSSAAYLKSPLAPLPRRTSFGSVLPRIAPSMSANRARNLRHSLLPPSRQSILGAHDHKCARASVRVLLFLPMALCRTFQLISLSIRKPQKLY